MINCNTMRSTSLACFTYMTTELSQWFLPNTGGSCPCIHTEYLICLWSFSLWIGREVRRRVQLPNVCVCVCVHASVSVCFAEATQTPEQSTKSKELSSGWVSGFNFPQDFRQVSFACIPPSWAVMEQIMAASVPTEKRLSRQMGCPTIIATYGTVAAYKTV